MSEEARKLTIYFGERNRVQGRLFADELLDIAARHGIRSSILLRGIQGFGAKHHRRSDRLLTLSEDLPLVFVALDAREQIEKLMQDVGSIGHEGLVTIERALLSRDDVEPGELSQTRDEAMKLTIYLGRHERVGGSPAFAVACRVLHDGGMAGATVLLGVDGTSQGERRRARFFTRNADVPVMVMSVGDPRKIAHLLGRLTGMLNDPLFTIERVLICKRDGVLLQPPDICPPRVKQEEAPRQKLTIIASEAARYENRSVYLELVGQLRTANAAGATSLRGIWGFHGSHLPHGDRLLSVRRHVPIITVTIDTPDRIATLFPIVDELTREQGLVTTELVPTSSALHTIPGL